MHSIEGAAAPGLTALERSTSDTARWGAGRVGSNGSSESPDFLSASLVGQALEVLEGENQAAQYLARLQAEQADPDELALVVATLYGANLRGFCRVIAKALGMRRG